MKLSLIGFFCLLISVMSLCAEDSAALPELPSVDRSDTPQITIPERSGTTPNVATPTANPRVQKLSQEQIDKRNRDKNWLTEGLKERELKAAELEEQQNSQKRTIIDEILEKSQAQLNQSNAANGSAHSLNNPDGSMKASISTTAWDPLPEPQTAGSLSSSIQTAESDTQTTEEATSYQKFDPKTGISNVFYNPATGSFENQPVDFSNPTARNAEERPWLQQNQTSTSDFAEQKRMEALEAQLVKRMTAEQSNPTEGQLFGPTLQGNPISPYRMENNSNPGSNLSSNTPATFGPENQQSANAASVAKMRMIEQERQKKAAEDKRPKAIDLHTSNLKGIEINPRF